MTGLRRRYAHWRLRRKVARLARTHTAIWHIEGRVHLDPPPAFNRRLCHICQHGRPTVIDQWTGRACCDHCGAADIQLPGALPNAGVPASEAHRLGSCHCVSLGRTDLDWREHERTATGLWAVA